MYTFCFKRYFLLQEINDINLIKQKYSNVIMILFFFVIFTRFFFKKKRNFASHGGDPLALLNVYRAFVEASKQDALNDWCQTHFISVCYYDESFQQKKVCVFF